ncbi:hypothetical protein [Ruegeria jejuensis]|uniref:hypothetical protein n=1 Tax=Ruegeria jejuensis TaxID=3233338 RepID=UPI00355B8D84
MIRRRSVQVEMPETAGSSKIAPSTASVTVAAAPWEEETKDERKVCAHPDCSKVLFDNNISGVCREHFHTEYSKCFGRKRAIGRRAGS